MMNFELLYIFALGIGLTVVALVVYAASKSDPNNNKYAPIRVRVDDKRRGGAPPSRRNEQSEWTQWDIFFWLFVSLVVTSLVVAYQL